MRESGYYWVKFFETIGWEISYFLGDKWVETGEGAGVYEPIEINETRIKNPDEK